MKKHRIIVNMIFISMIAISILFANSYKIDSDEWSKVEIQEAFISRQTSIDHRDASSAPEFGWHIKYEGSFLTKGHSLYAVMYVPVPLSKPLRLNLVERDVFADDFVSGVEINSKKKKYVLNKNNDFVILKRTAIFPDSKSGKNHKAEGAVLITKDFSDSVSFNAGDYTDYYKFPDKPSSLLLYAKSSLGKLDSPGSEELQIYPESKLMIKYYIIDAPSGKELIRIRSRIGGGFEKYKVYTAFSKDRFSELFKKGMIHLNKVEGYTSYFTYSDIAKVFMEFNRIETVKKCREKNTYIKKKRFDEFCKVVKEMDKNLKYLGIKKCFS